MARTFRNLTSLTWTGQDENGDAIVLPETLTSSLRNLKHLTHLAFEFATPHTFEDKSFTIAESTPRLALSDTYGYKACPHPSTSIDFYTTHPTLLTLLYFLRHTKVVRFGWTRSYKVYVWSRTCTSEDFDVEVYSK
ncbi:hypothetical protein JCM10213v2_006024 [Rhodosporidiobolus nylandii]